MAELKIYLKPLTDKNAQLVTRYTKNWAGSAKFQVYSSHLTLCDLTVNRSVMPNFSYTHPLPTRRKNDSDTENDRKNGLRMKKEMTMKKKGLVFLPPRKKEKRKADPHMAHCLLPDT